MWFGLCYWVGKDRWLPDNRYKWQNCWGENQIKSIYGQIKRNSDKWMWGYKYINSQWSMEVRMGTSS